MKINPYTRKGRRGFTLVELMVVIAIIAALAGVAYGPILRQMKRGDENQAMQNARQIYTALQAFSQDNSRYPCDDTAVRLKENNPDVDFGPLTGEFSNDYFRQLFYSQMDKEVNFYAKISMKNGLTTKTPDGKFANGKALEIGENGFSYVMMGEGRPINTNNTNIPLVMTSVEEGGAGDKLIFDGESFLGKAMVVRVDSSATWIQLMDKDDVFTSPDLFGEDRKGRPLGERYFVLIPEL